MEDLEKAFAERREWPRMAIEQLVDDVRLILSSHAPESVPRPEVVNMSEGGAGLLMPMRFDRGTRVTLQIEGETIPTLDLDAEIRWASQSPVSTGKYPLGIKFAAMPAQKRADLREFMDIMRERFLRARVGQPPMPPTAPEHAPDLGSSQGPV